MGELLALCALFMFSTNIIITKIASVRLNINLGFLISVTVNILFAVLLFTLHFIFREQEFHWNHYAFFLFLLSGFFTTYLGRFLFFESITRLGPARASAVQVSNPLFTFLIAWIFLGEQLTRVDLLAIIMILVGLFLVSHVHSVTSIDKEIAVTTEINPTEEGAKPNSFRLRLGKQFNKVNWRRAIKSGLFLALFSSLSYAIGNVVRGTAIKEWNEPILGALLGALIGLTLHCIFSFTRTNFFQQIRDADRTGLGLYIFSGVLTISAQICLVASMWYIPISIANLITLSTPIIVTPISYFLLKNQEGITVRTLIGGIMVLSGICFIVLM
jgi:drug/metabolite transporter (DMT)-like permease